MRNKSSSAPRFQTISPIPTTQQAVTQFLPWHTARWIRPVFREALAQEIQQGGIFFLLQHDLAQEFFSKKLLLLSRQSENFGNAFDDHDACTAEGLQGSIPNMDGWGRGGRE